ncbi:MAG: hypothetical protein MRY63_09225 [Neomegalonema sp.]|nr:hypothetical protein [Neomegalonema sp.]
MPGLVKFLLKNAAIGFLVGVAFVGALVALDLGGIGSLLLNSSHGLLGFCLMSFMMGLSFASVQMGMAVWSQSGSDDGDRGSKPRELILPAASMQTQEAPALVPINGERHRR